MENLKLEAKERTRLGKKAKALRASGSIPAIVYGKGMNSLPIEMEEKAISKFLVNTHSRNIIIDLKVGKDTMPVLMYEVQKDILSNRVIHIDFHRILMDEEIKTRVPIVLKGDAVGVKSDGGILVHPLREIEIKALPANIPAKIEIDVSDLKIGDAIHVSNLKPIKGVEYLTSAQEIIATVSSPTKEEEVAPAVVAPEAVAGVPAAEAGAAPAAGAGAAPGAAPPAAEAGKKEAAAAAKGAAPAAKAAAPAAKAEKPKK